MKKMHAIPFFFVLCVSCKNYALEPSAEKCESLPSGDFVYSAGGESIKITFFHNGLTFHQGSENTEISSNSGYYVKAANEVVDLKMLLNDFFSPLYPAQVALVKEPLCGIALLKKNHEFYVLESNQYSDQYIIFEYSSADPPVVFERNK